MLSFEECLAIILTSLYIIVVNIVGFQLIRHITFNHRLRSFQFSFLILCFIWLLFRTIWFCTNINISESWAITFVILAPNICQLAIFSLLVLYMAKLKHQKNWNDVKITFISCYFMSVFIMVLYIVLFAGLYGQNNTNQGNQMAYNLLDRMYYFSSGVYYSCLLLASAYYISSVYSTSTQQVTWSMAFNVSFIFFILLTRCIIDFSQSLGSLANSGHFCHGGCGAAVKAIDFFPFCMLIVWEIVPTLLILFYFRTIPFTRLHRFIKLEAYLYRLFFENESTDSNRNNSPLNNNYLTNAVTNSFISSNSFESYQPYLHLLPCFVFLPVFGLPPLTQSAFDDESENPITEIDIEEEQFFNTEKKLPHNDVSSENALYIPPSITTPQIEKRGSLVDFKNISAGSIGMHFNTNAASNSIIAPQNNKGLNMFPPSPNISTTPGGKSFDDRLNGKFTYESELDLSMSSSLKNPSMKNPSSLANYAVNNINRRYSQNFVGVASSPSTRPANVIYFGQQTVLF